MFNVQRSNDDDGWLCNIQWQAKCIYRPKTYKCDIIEYPAFIRRKENI